MIQATWSPRRASLIAGVAIVGQYTFIGEVVLIFWLLIKGVRLGTGLAAPDAESAAFRAHARSGV